MTWDMRSWTRSPLASLATMQKGRKVATFATSGNRRVKYLGASALENGPAEYAEPRGAVLTGANDILMLWDGERSGLVGRGEPGVVASTVCRLSPRSGTDGGFLYHALRRKFAWIQARRTGTGVPHVPKDLPEWLHLEHPLDQLEQQHIARTLDTIDEAIRKIQQVLAKLRLMKHGLLHDLLMRGIDENGALRDLMGHQEQFKDSPLGRLPRGWSCATVAQLLEDHVLAEVQDGNHGELHPKRADFVTEGVPFIMAKDMAGGAIDTVGCFRIRWSQYRSLRVGFAKPGDVLLSHKGTIGETAVVPPCLRHAMLTPQVTYYRVGDERRLSSRFLLWWFRSPEFQRRLRTLAPQSTRDYIPLTSQRLLDVPLPLVQEQHKITELLDAAMARIHQETAEVRKLHQLRSGIREDLLTGRVRVKVLEEAAP